MGLQYNVQSNPYMSAWQMCGLACGQAKLGLAGRGGKGNLELDSRGAGILLPKLLILRAQLIPKAHKAS